MADVFPAISTGQTDVGTYASTFGRLSTVTRNPSLDPESAGMSLTGGSSFLNDYGFGVGMLYSIIADQTDVVNTKLANLKASGETISITDMFEMQMKMNRLSQMSEMATNVVSAASGAISTIARNVK